MVEQNENAADVEKALITKLLGDQILEDPKQKETGYLTKDDAIFRKKHIEEVLYHFRLAVKQGDYYFGKASIKFYVSSLPEGKL